MKVVCGACDRPLRVEEWLADNVARCPRCDQVIHIPPATAPEGATAAPITVEEATELLRRRATGEAEETGAVSRFPKTEPLSAMLRMAVPGVHEEPDQRKTKPLPRPVGRPSPVLGGGRIDGTVLPGQSMELELLEESPLPLVEEQPPSPPPGRAAIRLVPAVSVAFVVGLIIGAAAGWLVGRSQGRSSEKSPRQAQTADAGQIGIGAAPSTPGTATPVRAARPDRRTGGARAGSGGEESAAPGGPPKQKISVAPGPTEPPTPPTPSPEGAPAPTPTPVAATPSEGVRPATQPQAPPPPIAATAKPPPKQRLVHPAPAAVAGRWLDAQPADAKAQLIKITAVRRVSAVPPPEGGAREGAPPRIVALAPPHWIYLEVTERLLFSPQGPPTPVTFRLGGPQTDMRLVTRDGTVYAALGSARRDPPADGDDASPFDADASITLDARKSLDDATTVFLVPERLGPSQVQLGSAQFGRLDEMAPEPARGIEGKWTLTTGQEIGKPPDDSASIFDALLAADAPGAMLVERHSAETPFRLTIDKGAVTGNLKPQADPGYFDTELVGKDAKARAVVRVFDKGRQLIIYIADRPIAFQKTGVSFFGQ